MYAMDKNESAGSPPAWLGLGGSGRRLALRAIQQARAYRVFPGPVPVMVPERDVTGQVLTHGRAWSIGVGGKQSVRVTRQARAYQVSGEVVLTSIFELDIQQLWTVHKGVPPEIHVIHPEIKELKNFPLPEGGKQMHREKMWAPRPHWKLTVDGIIDCSLYVLQYREISPSIALIHWSPGGHAILAPNIAYRLREELPDTMRLGISIVSKDDESRKQFFELLQIMDPEEVTRT